MPPVVFLLDSLSQWLQLPFILSGIKSLEVALPAEAERVTEFKSELMPDEVRLPRAKLVQSLTLAGQNLTALKIANFLVVLNTAPALRLFGPLPLLQTMLLAAGAGDWHVSMSADAVKALFLDDAGNFKFPKLQNLSIELLDDGAAVELSNVMHGRKMKSLRVPKLSNLTDVGWATVNRLKIELGVATTSWDAPSAFVKTDSRTSVKWDILYHHLPKRQGISPSWQALSFPHFCSAGWKQGVGIWD